MVSADELFPSAWRERAWRRKASRWEKDKWWLFGAYIGGDSTDSVRGKLRYPKLLEKRRRAHMPGRHIWAPVFGLRKVWKQEPSYVWFRRHRAYRSTASDPTP